MRILITALVIALAGCTSVPVARKFPEVPEDIKVACPALKQVENTTQLSKVLDSVVDNYASYHECKIKIDAWIEWYGTQKKIFDDVK